MEQLTSPSTKVAAHVATHRRPVAPAFVSSVSAEQYRRQVLDAHVQHAWQAPDPVAATENVLEILRLERLRQQAGRAQHRLLVGMGALVALYCLLHLVL